MRSILHVRTPQRDMVHIMHGVCFLSIQFGPSLICRFEAPVGHSPLTLLKSFGMEHSCIATATTFFSISTRI
jgi:hypothetical protein